MSRPCCNSKLQVLHAGRSITISDNNIEQQATASLTNLRTSLQKKRLATSVFGYSSLEDVDDGLRLNGSETGLSDLGLKVASGLSSPVNATHVSKFFFLEKSSNTSFEVPASDRQLQN